MSDTTRLSIVFLGGRGKEKFWVQILYRLSIFKFIRFYKLCFFPIMLLSWQNIGKVFDEWNWVALRLIAPRLNVLLAKKALLRMVLLALALNSLPACFAVAICNTGHGLKPQNQYLIRLLAPIDNDKLFIITSYEHCVSFARNWSLQEICQSFCSPNPLCPGNESQAYNRRARRTPRLPPTTIAGRS